MTTEELIAKYGEQYRTLITDAIQWLDEREQRWGTPRSNRDIFIRELIAHTPQTGTTPT